MAPGEKGYVALKRHLLGISDAQRQARRDALIACTPAEMRAAAENLRSRFQEGASVFLTHEEALKKAGRNLKALGAASTRIPH
jgi:hypothetical protein